MPTPPPQPKKKATASRKATGSGATGRRTAQRASAPAAGKSSTSRKVLVEQQILGRATALFAERGFAGTSLQDVADATGLTRPALYYYFSSKDQLLARIVRDTTMDVAERLEAVATDQPDLGPVAHLRELVRRSTVFQAEHRSQFQMLLRSEAELPADITDLYTAGRRRVLRTYLTTIERGVSAGVFRPVDARTAALAVIGMVNWVAGWNQLDEDAAAVAERLAEMAVASVLLHRGPDVAPATARDVLAMLKDDIALLEHRLDDLDRS